MTRMSAVQGVPAWNGNSPAAVATSTEKARSKPKRARLERFAPQQPSPAWQERGACLRKPDPDLWFPVGVSLQAMDQAAEAKRVCAEECPVRALCLRYAFEIFASDGVWGGATDSERQTAHKHVVRAGLKPTPGNLAAEVEWMQAGEKRQRRRQERDVEPGTVMSPAVLPVVPSSRPEPIPALQMPAVLAGVGS